MPRYDYSCLKGHTFEAIKAFGDYGKVNCPECGSTSEYTPFLPGSCNAVVKWWTAPPGHTGFETRLADNGAKIPVRPR